MKKFSKVLAVVLALTLLVATGVLPASAVDTENAALKLSFKNADGAEITSAAAGDVVDVYVSLKVDAYVQAMQFYVNYNSDYVSHSDIRKTEVTEIKNAKYAGNWLGDFADDSEIELTEGELYDIDAANLEYGYYLNWGAGATMTITPYNASTMPTPPLATTKLVKVVYATETSDQTLLVNTKGEFYEMVQLRFIATKDIAALDSSIFFFDNNLEKVIVNIDGENVPFSTLAINPAKNLNVTFEYAAGGSTGPVEPTVAVKNLDPKVQWRAAGSSDLYIGFEGELSGFTKDQAATVIASISEIGIEFSSTDATLATSIKATTNVVYDFTDDAGVYKFRAVVRKAMSEADAAGTITHNLYARAFVKIGDKAPITASDIISTTIYDEYTEGVAGGLATLAANLG